jgi:hypothetical protein
MQNGLAGEGLTTTEPIRRGNMKTWFVFVGVSLMVMVNVWGAAEAARRASAPLLQQAGQTEFTETKQAEVNAKMATVQMPFIANQGQMDANAACYATT